MEPTFCKGEAWDRIQPNHRRRFARLVQGLNKLLLEIQEYEPEAEWYLACDDLNLMVCPAHTGAGEEHQDNVACSMILRRSSGGDW